MADVDMPDAAASSTPSKSKPSGSAKTAKSGPGAESGSDGKKRFEVKKVSCSHFPRYFFNPLLIFNSGMQ